MDNLDIKTDTKRTENDESYAQDAATIEANMAKKKESVEAERLAKEEQKRLEEEKKTKEEAEKIAAEEEAERKKEEIIVGASTLAAGVINTILNGKKIGTFLRGLLLGFLCGLLCMFVLGKNLFTQYVTVEVPVYPVTEDSAPAGYTSLDFQNAILGDSIVRQDLEVLEQELIVSTTITKAGFNNWAIFSKVKTCQFVGSGVYTINMGKLDKEHISFDEKEMLVTVRIPHAVLSHVLLNEYETEFEDTEKGFLAFGDLNLTAEQYNEITAQVKGDMEVELNKQDLLDLADDYGRKKVWQILNPLVETVGKDVFLEVKFEGE